ncbi:hypothetical protein [Mucilaginibacter flavus]|uniref:hypothetical protein n=1 Tax=Mucilaginibacter flavus TaxID=931504 RepID=UPI0025B4082C|nr:hypothetical protein [Mucilaginibacter flavus]MDN3581884.1 hypothetical protein [Mucilaginibacter flavus]
MELERLFNRVYLRNFLIALPWIYLIGGTGILAIGIFIEFPCLNWNEFFTALGKTMIAGGVLSTLLKSIQFLGVIKEELSKIISDPEFIKKRYDLEQYWDTVTCALFENKFPAINDLIIKDIKRTYLPTKDTHYYEDSLQIFEIELIDKNLNIIKVIERRSLTMIPSKQPYSYDYPYKIEIKGNAIVRPTVNLDYFKINGIEAETSQSSKTMSGDNLAFGFNANISGGQHSYFIEYQVTRTFPLDRFSIVLFKMNHIHRNLRIQVFFTEINVHFDEAGILAKFVTNYQTKTYIEKEFVGLMYKGQGFTLSLEKK